MATEIVIAAVLFVALFGVEWLYWTRGQVRRQDGRRSAPRLAQEDK